MEEQSKSGKKPSIRRGKSRSASTARKGARRVRRSSTSRRGSTSRARAHR
jgi:hypothetical protein